MRNIAGFIALATLATCLLLAGRASVAYGNQCGENSLPVVQNSVWRMEVGIDEAAFIGPSIKDRLAHQWNDAAKRNYRWTSTAMPFDTGISTQMLEISAAVIADGVPLLEKGDIVDVHLTVSDLDFRKSPAPAILKRVCSGREEGCLDELRRTQEGRVTGLKVKGDHTFADHRKITPSLANLGGDPKKGGSPREVEAVSR